MDPIPTYEVLISNNDWSINDLRKSLTLKHKFFKVSGMPRELLIKFLKVYFILERHKKEESYISKLITDIKTNQYVLDFIFNTEPNEKLTFFLNDKMKHIMYDELIPECQKKLTVNKLLGHGAYGNVNEVCVNSKDCSYVMKLQSFKGDKKTSRTLQTIFWDEVTAMIYVNKHDPEMAPTLYAAWQCEINNVTHGVIVMEKMDGTLDDFKPSKKSDKPILDSLVTKAFRKIVRFKDYKIIHGDLKFSNIMYKIDNKGNYIVRIGDWGLSKIFDKYNSVYPRFVYYMNNHVFVTSLYNPILEYNYNYDLSLFMYVTLFNKNYSVLPRSYRIFFVEKWAYNQLKLHINSSPLQNDDWRKRLNVGSITRSKINQILDKAVFRSI